MITHYMESSRVKDILSHFIERPLLSVQKRRGKLKIQVKGNPGIHQAWTARDALGQIGIEVIPYGHVDDIDAGNPSSVRLVVKS